MRDKPPKLLKLAADLFENPEDQDAFVNSVLKRHPYKPALVWMDFRPEDSPFKVEERREWQPGFVDRLIRDQRPGQHAWHEEGRFYCMTFSSVFESCVFENVPAKPEVVVDLCASPGGKTVMAWRTLKPRVLICNEVIGKRTAQLLANVKRCGIHPSWVTSLDSAVFVERCPASVDLVVVDAPCSGQSLIAKGKHVTACFHNHVINHNRNRQRRILSNAAKMVKPGGRIAYMTCTYAEKENEGNLRWLMKNFPQLVPEEVPALKQLQSHLAEFPCYRMWPQQGLGAGGFTSILRNDSDEEARPMDVDALSPVWETGDM